MGAKEIGIRQIHVDDGFWNKRIRNAVEKVVPYQWRVLNDREPGAEPSHAIRNFKIAAGMEEGEFYGYQFQDSDVAKWIEAASYSLIYEDSPEIRAALDEAIGIIEKAQQADGYLDTHYILKKPDRKWKEIAHGHELYCTGHMLEAAVAYRAVTGDDRLLRVMERNVELIRSVFGSEEGKLDSYPGHEEIELALMKAYHATGEKKYLELADYFVENRGTRPAFLEEERFLELSRENRWLEADYHQAHARIRDQKTAEGHAVRAMYFYTGAADVALEKQDPTLKAALDALWDNVTGKRMYLTGGVGSQGEGERFTIDYDLPNDTCYTETCAAIGLAMWALRMLKLDPDVKYADVMERALYNNVLSGISEDGEHYFYVNPLMLKPDVARYRKDHESVEPERVKWFGCACCPPNVIRTLCGLGGYVYTQDGDAVYQHLYVGNKAQFFTSQGEASLSCESSMPWEGNASVTYHGPSGMTLYLRVPSYAENFSVKRNGEPLKPEKEKGYVRLTPQDGDVFTFHFDMTAQFVQANPRVTEDCGRAAVCRGPLVYCAEQADNGELLHDFTADLSCAPGVSHSDLFGGIVSLEVSGTRSNPDEWPEGVLYRLAPVARIPARLTLIPYFLWNNRGVGEMLVWMNAR